MRRENSRVRDALNRSTISDRKSVACERRTTTAAAIAARKPIANVPAAPINHANRLGKSRRRRRSPERAAGNHDGPDDNGSIVHLKPNAQMTAAETVSRRESRPSFARSVRSRWVSRICFRLCALSCHRYNGHPVADKTTIWSSLFVPDRTSSARGERKRHRLQRTLASIPAAGTNTTRTIRFPSLPMFPPATLVAERLDYGIAFAYDAPKRRCGSASMPPSFDRAAEDLGNSIHLEHVNVQSPTSGSPRCSTWRARAHARSVPQRSPPSCGSMSGAASSTCRPAARCPARPHRPRDVRPRGAARPAYGGARKLGVARGSPSASPTTTSRRSCPWGNRVRRHAPDASRFGHITLGLPYVEFDVPTAPRSASPGSIVR